MSSSPERAYYRIVYPLRDRPRLELGGRQHEVVDCSEGGLRFQLTSGAPPELGAPVRAVVRFHEGQEVAVEGAVVRVQGGHVALRLARGIPLAVILAEQRYLRAHYPTRF
jgi:PilZ domain